MTNKEAIEYLKNINSRYPCSLDTTFQDECEMIALNLAIKALEERPKGEWIADDEWGNCHCSVCNFENNRQPYYCEECGARMESDV